MQSLTYVYFCCHARKNKTPCLNVSIFHGCFQQIFLWYSITIFGNIFDPTHKKKKIKKKTDHKNPLVALAVYNAAIIFKPFMHNDENWPNIH